MRKSFLGYYQPTDEEYQELWTTGLIVFDTNVLLDLYRLPEVARNEVFNALDKVKERIWIPHQVALEFQRRRFTVISNERKTTSDALKSAQNLLSTLENQVAKLEIEKRGLNIDSKPLVADLKAAHDKLSDAINKVHESQADIKPQDNIREKLDELLEGKVGKGFDKQSELDECIKNGEDRYLNKIPPGYEDSVKDKNPNEAFFHFDGIKFPRKFGDLILWKQLIQHAKSDNIKHVIFVTGDRKEDWWWKEQGKTIGPRSELVREIVSEASIDVFWMYELGNFLEQAKIYTSAKISSDTIIEIDNVSSIEESLSSNSVSAEYNNLIKKSKSFIKNNSTRKVLSIPYDDLVLIKDYLMDVNDLEIAYDNSINTVEFYKNEILHYYFIIDVDMLYGKAESEKYELIYKVINNSDYNQDYCRGVLLIYEKVSSLKSSVKHLSNFALDIVDYSLPVDSVETGLLGEGKFKIVAMF